MKKLSFCILIFIGFSGLAQDSIRYNPDLLHYQYFYGDSIADVSPKEHFYRERVKEREATRMKLNRSLGTVTIDGTELEIVDVWEDTLSRKNRAVWAELNEIPPGYDSKVIHLVKPRYVRDNEDHYQFKDKKHGKIRREFNMNQNALDRMKAIKDKRPKKQ